MKFKTKRYKVLLSMLLIFTMLMPLVTVEAITGSVTFPVIENQEFGGAVISATQEEFAALGAEFGDSLDVRFSNGFTLEDVPYYDGYYGKVNTPAVVNYPGLYIDIAYCSGDRMWARSGCSEGDTVTLSIHEKAKYLDNQNAMASVYSDDRSAFSSDDVYANFRAMTGGNLRADTFYRGASPVNNVHLRASTVDSLLRQNGIRYVLNLADNEERISSYIEKDDFSSDYAASLYKNGNTMLLALTASYRSEEYNTSLVKGLKDMMSHEGPYYIHCTEGKDRTGFVCALVEALAGASYEEIEADYMKTYDNYYGITENIQPEKYNALKELRLHDMLCWLAGVTDDTDLAKISLVEGAESYLRNGGMSDQEIEWFKTFLTSDVIIASDQVPGEVFMLDSSVQAAGNPGENDSELPEGVFWVDGTNGMYSTDTVNNVNTVEPANTAEPVNDAPTGEIFYVDIPDSTPYPASSSRQSAGSQSAYGLPGYQPSYGSSGLSLSVSCSTAPAGSSMVNVTVTVYLHHAQLSSVSMPLTITLDGQSANLSAASVNGSGSTTLGSHTFTVNLPDGESRSLSVSASWAFNGNYGGEQISTVNCSDTAYISR